MKKLTIILLALMPMMLQAGVIVLKNGDHIEDISIKSSDNGTFVYVDENGVEASVVRNEVSAVLYDDGHYEEIKSNNYEQTTVKTTPAQKTSKPSITPVVVAAPAVVEQASPTPAPIVEQKTYTPVPATNRPAKRIVPKACKEEGKQAYDRIYKDMIEKSLLQGYSKPQAYKIAYDAARAEQQKAIDECYHRIVEMGENYAK